jgi:hypothetical protein
MIAPLLALAPASISWSPKVALAPAAHVLTAKASDASGRVSAASTPVTVTPTTNALGFIPVTGDNVKVRGVGAARARTATIY